MSKKTRLTKAQRIEWAGQIRTLRQGAGLTQQQLADNAGVARQTVSNTEKRLITPQSDVLIRMLDVLGQNVNERAFEEQTELWLSMMGTLIEAMPEAARPPVVNSAIRVLSDGVRDGQLRGVGASGDTRAVDEIPILAPSELEQKDLTLAADRDPAPRAIDEPAADEDQGDDDADDAQGPAR